MIENEIKGPHFKKVHSFLLTTSTLERRHIIITMFLKLESYLEHMRMRIDPSRILGANATAKFLRVFPKNEVHAFYSNMFKQLNQSVIDDNIHPKTSKNGITKYSRNMVEPRFNKSQEIS